MKKRISVLDMRLEPAEIMVRDGWQVALTYQGEKIYQPLFISDLSHLSKWFLQARELTAMQPEGLIVPTGPGEATLEKKSPHCPPHTHSMLPHGSGRLDSGVKECTLYRYDRRLCLIRHRWTTMP